MKRHFALLATIAAMLALLLVAPLASAGAPSGPIQVADADGLVAVIAQLNNTLNNNEVALVNVEKSLNDVNVLNDVLNKSPILSGNHVLNGSPILNNSLNNLLTIENVLNHSLNGNKILNDNHIFIGQVIGIAILSGGGIVVFV